MVIALVPFENSPKFNYVRKMSVVPAGYTGAMDGGGISTPLNHQFPRLNAARNSIFDAMRGDRTIMEEMGQPVEKKILSGLTRDMMEILLDENASDDTKANLYLNAINRYLTYTGKVNSLVPIATVRRKRAKPTPETVGISPQHIYNPIGKVKPTRDLFEKGGMFDDLVRPEFDKMASTSFHTPKREGGREGKDGRVGGPGAPPPPPPPRGGGGGGKRTVGSGAPPPSPPTPRPAPRLPPAAAAGMMMKKCGNHHCLTSRQNQVGKLVYMVTIKLTAKIATRGAASAAAVAMEKKLQRNYLKEKQFPGENRRHLLLKMLLAICTTLINVEENRF
jgi:hypothetical protein